MPRDSSEPEPRTPASIQAMAKELASMSTELEGHAVALGKLVVTRFESVRKSAREVGFGKLRSLVEEVGNVVNDMVRINGEGTLSGLSDEDEQGRIYRKTTQRNGTKKSKTDKASKGAKPKK